MDPQIDTPRHTGFPQFRGASWVFGRIFTGIAKSALCGACFGVCNALGMMLGAGSNFLSGEGLLVIAVAGVVGMLVGLAASPLMIAVTTSADPARGLTIVLSVTCLAAVLLGAAIWDFELGPNIVGTLIVYGVACLSWRVVSGSGAYTYDLERCGQCGYSLKGLGAPVCPECGERFGAPNERGDA